jgi:uroporphyrinogen III methyltransferase/synthase
MSSQPVSAPDRPLAGRTVVVTRPRARSGPFERLLREHGARVLSLPTIRIAPLEQPQELLGALGRLQEYDWIVFTSVNAVEAVAESLRAGSDELRELRAAAIGPATARAVEERLGLEVEIVPGEYRAEELAAALLEHLSDASGTRVLLPRAAEAREALPRLLREAGIEVDEVPAYRTLLAEAGEAGKLRERLARGEVDWITFTASSTVRGFVEAVGTETGRARVAAIGPITAGTARSLGLVVDVTAGEYTIPGLVQALVQAETDGRPKGGET